MPFAPNARRVAVNIDMYQLDHMQADVKICAHLSEFFDWWHGPPRWWDAEWNAQCTVFKHRSPPPTDGSYAFNDHMTRLLPPGTCMVIDGGGTALYTGFQSSYIKEGSRLICSMSMSAMGSGLPEAVGACFAAGKQLTTCLIGDGSLMLNLQELQTIATHRLPIKIFVINNGGYLAIRQTQKAFQDGRYYGVGGADLQFPDVHRIGEAFGIPTTNFTEIAFKHDGPAICEWICPENQKMVRQGYRDGKPLALNEMVYA
jgi:acetolactate synthase-1/2/3 large subunit